MTVIPNSVSIIANGPHPENAKKLVDWILSESTEALLAAAKFIKEGMDEGKFPEAPLGPTPVVTLDIQGIGILEDGRLHPAGGGAAHPPLEAAP